jgi:hypothetical protein
MEEKNMHMTKKLISLMLVIGLMCTVMIGCNPTPDTPNQPNTPGNNQGNATTTETTTQAPESTVTHYGNYSTEGSPIKIEENFAKLIQHSAETFNAGSSYSEDKIAQVYKIADYIANYDKYVEEYGVQDQLDELYEQTGFTLDLGFGAAMIKHYLGMTGETYDYSDRMPELITHPKVSAAQSSCISAAMKAAENIVVNGQSGISVNQVKPIKYSSLKSDDGTIYYALGSYHALADLSEVSRTGDTFSATVTFRIIDYYDWAEDSKTPEFADYIDKLDDTYRALVNEMVDMATLESFCQADLAQLHNTGLAQDFMAQGSIVYNITWTVGQTFEQATVTPAQ